VELELEFYCQSNIPAVLSGIRRVARIFGDGCRCWLVLLQVLIYVGVAVPAVTVLRGCKGPTAMQGHSEGATGEVMTT
jgi:hypothetical protein